MLAMSHEHHTFHNPPSATPADVRRALDRNDIVGVTDAMVGCALYGDGDWKASQELYLTLLDHPDHQVQALAATCLGHLARVYGQLDEDRVVPHSATYAPDLTSGGLPATRWRTLRSSCILGVRAGVGACGDLYDRGPGSNADRRKSLQQSRTRVQAGNSSSLFAADRVSQFVRSSPCSEHQALPMSGGRIDDLLARRWR